MTIDQYMDKYPTTKTQTLAKMYVAEFGGVVNNVRCQIQHRRGSRGDYHRSQLSRNADKQYQKKWIAFKEGLAKERREASTTYKVPAKVRRVLFMNDLHFPFVDDAALKIAIDYGIEHDVNTIYLNGDIIDCEPISRYASRKKHTFLFELEQVRRFLAYLRDTFPDADIFYKLGNHEDRFEAYMLNNAERLLDVPEFQMDHLLRFKEYGVKMIGSKQLAMLGKLAVIHGHEYRMMTNPVSPARSLFLKAKQAAIMGHNHQSTKQSGKRIDDQVYFCWSVGCLCDMKVDYHPFNEWSHGFAYIEVERNGNFIVALKDIINGQLY